MFARQIQEVTKVREVVMIQDLLQRLKDEKVRSDFLNKRNGACAVDKLEMEFIDKFAQQVVPVRPSFSNEPTFANSAKNVADHFSFLIDARNRQFLETGFTYEKAKELFNRIQSCGYWEKDVKFVEVTEESRAENDTPNTEDLESKDGKSDDGGEKLAPVSAPAPAQVPAPSFNGNVGMMQQQQHQYRQPEQQVHHARAQHQQAPLPAPTNMKNTVAAIENSYFNQMKFSQPQQIISNGMPVAPVQNDFGGNFSFLQESELDSPATPGSHQKMPVNVIQPKQPVQHQQMQQVQPAMAAQAYKNSNFHPQSPIAAGQMFPPGLKVQQPMPNQPASHIPYQASPQQLNQQPAVSSQVPMIPKQHPTPVNGNQAATYGTSTPPLQQSAQQSSRPAYPMVPKTAQYQQQGQNNQAQNLSNAKPNEKKPAVSQKQEGSGDGSKGAAIQEKDKPADYQQQPQIDTWTNETAAQSGGNNYSSRGTAGGYNRSNRASGGGAAGGNRSQANGEAKFNNYR